MTRERISRILELREILLSIQTCFTFSLVKAAVVCAILDSISGLEPSSVVTEACDCLKRLSIYPDLCVDATGVVFHQLGILVTDIHAVGCVGFVETLD